MIKKKISYFFILCLISCNLCSTPANKSNVNIIFDIGGVLIQHQTSPLKLLKNIGLFTAMMYLLRLNNPKKLRSRLFETLNQLDAVIKNDFGATDEKGSLLPNILCDWITGHKTSAQISSQVQLFTQDNPGFFYNNAEKNVIVKIVEFMANSKILIDSTYPLQSGLNILKECKARGYNLFILSNWDPETFKIAEEKYPEIFEYFDKENMVISGEIGLMKPDAHIYEYILEKYNLDPQTCIFLDDQSTNIKMAESFGINCILCKKLKYQEILKMLDSIVYGQNVPATG